PPMTIDANTGRRGISLRHCNVARVKLKARSFQPLPLGESKLFDVARATSALLVLIGHLYQIIVLPTFGNSLATRAFFVLAGYSVMVFFVISGYMIGLSIYRNISSNDFLKFSLG